jgi:uncharacterized protein with GYD domain
MVEAAYTAEGLKGLQKDKASGRQKAVNDALEAVSGKLEVMYYAFGDYDVVMICDFPDNVSAAALATTVSASGLVRSKTTPLLTIDEADKALAATVKYRAPGS